jgi:nitrate/TMAO reductase-like tetraheme cytochrome c subunit
VDYSLIVGEELMRYFVLAFIILSMLPSSGSAGYKEDFERGFLTKPWAGQQIEENQCISCHSSDQMKPEFQEIVDAWQPSWHAQNGISCENCHGGDPKDAESSMSRERGFVGTPQYQEVPEFCGKCHIGILSSYLESGHGKALKASKKAPNCVTCHGSHNIRKASIEIINPQLCTKCHSYERAKIMKVALFAIETRISQLDQRLQELKQDGIYTGDDEKSLFSTQAEFRTLFHTVDVALIRSRTDEFTSKLDQIDANIQNTYQKLRFRKNLSAFFLMSFAFMGIIIFLMPQSKDD